MEEYDIKEFEKINEYFNYIKEKLRKIRKRKSSLNELEGNLKFYKSPVLFLRYFLKHGNSSEIKESKDYIAEKCIKLDKKYSHLREKYRKRFDHLEYNELIEEYKKKTLRILDLEEREDNLKNIKEKICFAQLDKMNQFKGVYRHFKDEYERRKRDFNELQKVMAERGINIEYILTNHNIYSSENSMK